MDRSPSAGSLSGVEIELTDVELARGADHVNLLAEHRTANGAASISLPRHRRTPSCSPRSTFNEDPVTETVCNTGGSPRVKPFVAMVAIVAALGGLVFGYDIGGSGGSFVMTGFREHFGWPVPIPPDGKEPQSVLLQMSLINALFPLGALIGAVPAGMIADRWGRRKAIIASSLIFTFAAAVQALAPVMAVLLIGRVIGGAGIGILSAVVPIFISEMSPEHFRGRLSTLWQLAVTVGIVMAGAMNLGLAHWEDGWRLSYGFNLVFSLALALLMLLLMPESPRWLCMAGRPGEASGVLGRVRWPAEVQPELDEICAKVEEELSSAGDGTWAELLAPPPAIARFCGCSLPKSSAKSGGSGLQARALLGAGLQFFQQVSGINAIMFFAPALFARYFSSDGALYGTLAVNILNHAATYIAVALVDRSGRVTLLVISGASMAVCLLAAAVFTSTGSTSDMVGYLLIALSCGFVVSFAYGWGPVVWTVCAEIFPLRVRGKAVSITTAVNWGSATAVGLLFPIASSESGIGLSGTLAVFAVCCTAGTAVVQLFLPETADTSLEEIDDKFSRHKPNIFRRFWASGNP